MQQMGRVAFLGEALSANVRVARSPLRKCARRYPRFWSASVEQVETVVSAKRLRRGDVLDLPIEQISLSGAGISRIRDGPGVAAEDVGLTVYTPKGAAPGDIVRCALVKIRRNPRPNTASIEKSRAYAEARFVERTATSPTAIAARCDHFGNFRLGGGGCGGCSSMTMAYEAQLEEKQAQMVALFRNFPGMNPDALRSILPSDKIWNYRNKMEFSFGRKWFANKRASADFRGNGGEPEFTLGLHAPQRFDKIVEIRQCHIQEEIGNQILAFVRRRAAEMLLEPFDTRKGTGYMRNLAIRTARNAEGELEVMLNIITSPCEVPGRLLPLAEEVMDKFSPIVCVVQNMPRNNATSSADPSLERLICGNRQFIVQKLCGLSFQISANSFFQTNAYQAELLYNAVIKAAAPRESDVVFDLFCGTGTIGLSLASHCKKVYGFEIVDTAIEDAGRNARINGIENAEFAKVNLEKKKESLLSSFSAEAPDVIVVDPPRAGLHKWLVKQLASSDARRIIYVSCNPSSQMRDLKLFHDFALNRYRVTEVQPVCMFPHTHHVESVVTLVRQPCENLRNLE